MFSACPSVRPFVCCQTYEHDILQTNELIFLRALLCVARTMLSQDVRLSVCLSVTRRYCFETTKHIMKLFSPSGSHTILVFPLQTLWQYSDGDPSNGALNARP